MIVERWALRIRSIFSRRDQFACGEFSKIFSSNAMAALCPNSDDLVAHRFFPSDAKMVGRANCIHGEDDPSRCWKIPIEDGPLRSILYSDPREMPRINRIINSSWHLQWISRIDLLNFVTSSPAYSSPLSHTDGRMSAMHNNKFEISTSTSCDRAGLGTTWPYRTAKIDSVSFSMPARTRLAIFGGTEFHKSCLVPCTYNHHICIVYEPRSDSKNGWTFSQCKQSASCIMYSDNKRTCRSNNLSANASDISEYCL